ncbi:FHA domain-containing protein [Agromyces sp. SYSU T0242]|uniref:FHA domain-containing protein n=1 Tax=Agromyces litoreus TaxID=3158561 RepID=UPI003394D220
MVDGAVRRRDEPGTGEWDVVVGARFIAAVAAPAHDRVLTALAEAAAIDDLELESLVSRIPMGAGGVEHLGLVWWPPGDGPLTAIVRGGAVIDLASPGGARRLDSRGIRPWHLAEFAAVTRLRIAGPESPLEAVRQAGLRGTAVSGGRAAFRASAVEWSWRDVPPGTGGGTVSDDTALIRRPSRSSASHPGPTVGLPTKPLGIVDDDTVRYARGDGADADTVLTAAVRSRLATADGRERTPAPDDTPGSTRDRGAAAVDSIGAPRYRVVGGPGGDVAVPVLIGRNPTSPRIGGEAVSLVRVASPAGVVSATHLELRMEGSRLVAADLRSTNGTVVRSASGRRRLRSGESVVVVPGTSLELGGDTIVEILPALGSLDA